MEGREEFIQDNAVSLLKARDLKIERMRKTICRLERSRNDMRRLIKELNAQLESRKWRV